jgi:hypothetical protein
MVVDAAAISKLTQIILLYLYCILYMFSVQPSSWGLSFSSFKTSFYDVLPSFPYALSSSLFNPYFWWEHSSAAFLRRVIWEIDFLYWYIFIVPSYLLDIFIVKNNFKSSASGSLL